MPKEQKNNSRKIEIWWGKNRGIGTYYLQRQLAIAK
jgi:hypothetical protein